MYRVRLKYLHLPTSAKLTFTVPIATPDHSQFDAQVVRAAGIWLSALKGSLDLHDFVSLSSVMVGEEHVPRFPPIVNVFDSRGEGV